MRDREVRSESWKHVEPYLASVFEATTTPYALLDADFRFVAVNPAYAAVTGRTPTQLLGSDVFDVFPESPGSAVDSDSPVSFRRSLNAVLRTGEMDAMSLIRYDLEVDGEFAERFWNVTNIPILDDDGSVKLILNHPEEVTTFINERIRLRAGGDAPDSFASSSQTRAVEEVFTAEFTRLEKLNELALAMVAASDREQVGRAVVRDGVALAGASGGVLVMFDSERFDMFAHHGIADESVARWSAFTIDVGNEPFSDAIMSGEPLFFQDARALLERYPRMSDDVDANPTHGAWAILPLRVENRVAGAIGLIYDAPQTFAAPLRLVLYTLANLTAQAASRAQMLEEQRAALDSVEDALEPRLDPIADVSVTHLYRAATVASGAGGDWYDIIGIDDATTLITIGDVANHGARVVGEMARVRASVHALAFVDHEPCDIAFHADRALTKVASTHSTSIIATLDSDTMTFTWTCAGHPYPIVVSDDGEARLLDETHGAPLGVGVTDRYGQQRYELMPGDTLVLYSDGLIEESDEDIVTGMERLCRLAAAFVEKGSDDLATDLFLELRPDGHHIDDIAIVTLHYAPDTSPRS